MPSSSITSSKPMSRPVQVQKPGRSISSGSGWGSRSKTSGRLSAGDRVAGMDWPSSSMVRLRVPSSCRASMMGLSSPVTVSWPPFSVSAQLPSKCSPKTTISAWPPLLRCRESTSEGSTPSRERIPSSSSCSPMSSPVHTQYPTSGLGASFPLSPASPQPVQPRARTRARSKARTGFNPRFLFIFVPPWKNVFRPINKRILPLIHCILQGSGEKHPNRTVSFYRQGEKSAPVFRARILYGVL